MKYVTGKKLTAFLFTCLFVVGCKDPELEMSPLGKKLPAPTLKGTNPFQQDFDSQNYARVQGSCDTRVSTVFVSFDKSVWHQAPTSPDLTGTSLSAGQTNDIDCSDGSFDIYLTKNDLLHLWGINSGSDDVNAIYIKGLSAIGDTETLTLLDMNSPGNGGGTGGSAIATTINLDKNWPRGYAGTSQCGSFHIYLNNASGYRATHTSNVTFRIKQSIAGGTPSTIIGYPSWENCSNGTNATDVFQVPAGSDYTEVVYRFPDSPIDGLLTFTLAYPSALTANPVPVNVTLRSSDASSTYRWLSMDQTATQIYKNICYPFQLRSQMYNNSQAYDQFGGTINITATDSRLKFYTNESCTTRATEYTFANYDPVLKGFMKFVPSAGDTESFVNIKVTAAAATGNTYTYDSSSAEFRADLSDKNSVSKLEFWGPRDIANGDCHRYQVVTMNSNGTALPLTTDLNVSLGTSQPNLGQFFADDACQTATSSTTISKNKSGGFVYFRPATTTPGSYKFNISAQGLTSASPSVVIQSLIRQFKIAPMDLAAGGCKAISVGIIDGAGIYKTAPIEIATTLQVHLNPGGYATIYADANCSTMLGSSQAPMTIPQGSTTGAVYIKTAGLAGASFTILVNSITGLFGDDRTGVFQ
ncbi:hypothetical protein [Bdellovibrio sp.]|uniref:hypothetical protein n=1 Tax=Bdellovibrio sp. TaxID=28201 RepID=UPI0032214A0F